MKKRVVKRKSSSVKGCVSKGTKKLTSPLSGAIKDLSSEVKKLSGEKSSLKEALSNVSSSLDGNRNLERELQRKIARLIEKEAKLNKKRKILGTKIDGISDKLNKISKIRSEMSDL